MYFCLFTLCLAKLTRGEDVVLSDGTTIRSRDCLFDVKTLKGAITIIASCNYVVLIDSFVTNPFWEQYYSENVTCIVHQVTLEVYTSERYTNWRNKFPMAMVYLHTVF